MSKRTILDDFYTREYSCGSWMSYERVAPGTVRVIDGVLCYAGCISPRRWYQKPEVLWFDVDISALPQNKESHE